MSFPRHVAPVLASVLAALLGGACVSNQWTTSHDQSVLETTDGRYRAEIPAELELYLLLGEDVELGGWIEEKGSWFGSHQDREHLQMPDVITVGTVPVEERLSELGCSAGTPPLALADRWIEELRTLEPRSGSYLRLDPPAIEVLEKEPATIAGAPGLRLHWKAREPNGLCIEHLAYGVQLGDRWITFERKAPALVYFERYLLAFEQLVASFAPTDERSP